jgi:hypothetical protein
MIGDGGTLGSQGNAVLGSTMTLTTATNNLAAGEQGILFIAKDNAGTTDADHVEVTSVTGGTGTWTKLAEYTNGQGVAAAGVTLSIWRFVASGATNIGTVITINFSGNVAEKAASFWKYTTAVGKVLGLTSGGGNPIKTATDASANFGNSSLAGLPSLERLYLGAMAREGSAISPAIGTTDFTTITEQASRANVAAVTVWAEYRINTSTGETIAFTSFSSGDGVGILMALQEEDAPSGGGGGGSSSSRYLLAHHAIKRGLSKKLCRTSIEKG